jgi:hypothetical protein
MQDIILITTDCWRYDAVDQMPKLKSVTSEWTSGSVMCAAAATNGVFPAILASRFYPELYEDDGSIRKNTASLPSVLGEHGYSTGGFVASNPFLGKWSGHFDAWWNDGMSADGVDANREEVSISLVNKINRFANLIPRVPAEKILKRADDWWEQADSPRFLWIHLMEPHEPYLPGFQLSREIGLLKSYATIIGDEVLTEDQLPTWMRRHLKRLHHQCNKRLDGILAPWLKRHEDATFILTGDHGEEFDHGHIGHARLYDETVRVPLLSNESLGSSEEELLIRQLDLAPLLLSSLDIDVPSGWEGAETADPVQPQEIINGAPGFERTFVGIRSEAWKLIRAYDWSGELQESEVYQIESDPTEENPKSESVVPSSLRTQLDEFVDRPAISQTISGTEEMKSGFNSDVENRLRELGYMN